eukprot:gene30175-36453_t
MKSLLCFLVAVLVAAVVAEDKTAELTRRQANAAAAKDLNDFVKEAKKNAKPAAAKNHIRKNAKVGTMDHKDESGVLFLREYVAKQDCSGDHVRDLVLFNANPSFYYDENDVAVNRVKYSCNLKTGDMWIDFCELTDAACANPTHTHMLAREGECSNSEYSMYSFVGECKPDTSFLKYYSRHDMSVGAEHAEDLDNNDMSKAMFIRIFNNDYKISNLWPEQQDMECNPDIVEGFCVDTRGVKSGTYIPTAFDAAYVSTYSKYNGGGEWKRTDFHEPTVNGGEFFYAYRHMVKDWYSTAFHDDR